MPRVVEMFARRLQLQERMTQEIAQFLNEVLHPKGVGVRVTAQHLCSMMRGVRKLNAKMVTQARLGKFEEKETFDQFYQEICQRDSISAAGDSGGAIWANEAG
jgi:GTP cyclohydrolase IA